MEFKLFCQASFFLFTWFLLVSYRHPIFIYVVFPWFLPGFFFFFSLTWFLHVSYRIPCFIIMIFTCFLQTLNFNLYGFYMFITASLFFIYMVYTCFKRLPFNFAFAKTWFLHFLTGPFFFIYMVFICFFQALFLI